MNHHQVLLSITLVGLATARRREIEDALQAVLPQLKLVATTTTYPGVTLITSAPDAELPAPELPVPADQPAPEAVVEPDEQAIAVPADQQTIVPPAVTDVEVAPMTALSLKFEAVARVLDLSTTDEVQVAQGEQSASQLVAESVDASVPGLIAFIFAGTSYKFPTDEQHKIAASVVVGEKNKRVKFDVVEASDQLQAGTIVLGAGDAELLTAEE